MRNGNILNQIELAFEELPKSEQKIAKYILDYSKDVLYMNIKELAEKSKSSSAAVVRFCKSIGVESFGNLKVRISAESSQGITVGNLDIEDREAVSSIVEKTLSNTIQVFEDTAHQIETVAVENVVEMLQKADMVYVYGVGASFLIAEDIAQKWRRLGKKVYAISDYHLLLSTMATQNENAVFWGISYSGQTKEVLLLIEKAKSFGMSTIGLSRIGQHKLAGSVDVLLTTARAPEARLRSAATSSRFAQLFVIDIVFLAYAAAQYEFTIEQLEKSRHAVIDLKDEW